MQQPSKRKLPDDSTNPSGDKPMSATTNPLLNAAKKAKRDNASSNKRKLANAEVQPGGLLIVRAPSSSAPTATAAPAPSTSKPASKKFKSSQPSNSQPLPSTSHSFTTSSQPLASQRYRTPDADPALDDAVRAMDEEAARLQPTPKKPTATTSSTHSRDPLNPKFHFPAHTQPPTTTDNNPNGATKRTTAAINKHKGKRRETIIDVSAPLPELNDDTPQIQRNKRLRAGAMAAIAADNEAESTTSMVLPPETGSSGASGSSSTGSGGHRRKSSISGRGKRISNSFEATGVITQPHNSVSDTSFYKHIDADLPDSERLRQLLIWCSARAASTQTSSSLPQLSAKAMQVLKKTQEDIVKQLALRMVQLSLFSGSAEQERERERGGEKMTENAQNVVNRKWEGVYGEHIKSAMEEEESWKKVNYFYDTHFTKLRNDIEKRRALLTEDEERQQQQQSSSSSGTGGAPSAKAQGKRREKSVVATIGPRERDFDPPFQSAMHLARKVLLRSQKMMIMNHTSTSDEPSGSSSSQPPPDSSMKEPGPSVHAPSIKKGINPDSRPLVASAHPSYNVDATTATTPTTAATTTDPDASSLEQEVSQELESESASLDTRMADVEFKLDHLNVYVSQARATSETARIALDRRFEMLTRALDARDSAGRESLRRLVPGGSASGAFSQSSSSLSSSVAATTLSGGEGGGVLGRYVSNNGGGDGYGYGDLGGRKQTEEAEEALELLRALASVDAARPPDKVGEAARRAVKEVQRVKESGGVGIVGERRVTEVPVASSGVVMTPRKTPGTPRRGTSTPSRPTTPSRGLTASRPTTPSRERR